VGTRGRLAIAVAPDGPDLWTVSEDSRFLSRVSISARGEARVTRVPLPEEVIAPTAIQISGGEIFVSASGKIYPLDTTGALRRSSPFFGLPAGLSLQIARTFTNFDPTTMIGPSFENVLPEDADARVRD
jgi:DNA-binding beta-propeller fold protein YncE